MLLRNAGFRRLIQARDRLVSIELDTAAIATIAAEAELSESHFIRLFEALFGATPHQYRIRARIEAAKHLLATSSLTVTDVCMEVGFSSLGSFSESFKRRVGESPSAFQRRIRPLVAVPGLPPAVLVPGCLSLMARLPPTAFRSFGEAPGG